jgi:AcrR family transcriptional regulator
LAIIDRKERQRAAREQRIVAAARTIAEREGWSAVTVRRLADEIEYSQPVLYSHFQNRDAVVAGVALQGFRELTSALEKAPRGARGPRDALERVARAYLDFALRNPSLYEAMFSLPTILRFAEEDTRPELRSGFEALAAVITPFSDDAETTAETFWGALHGLVELERGGRLRPAARAQRLALIIRAFANLRHDVADAS